MRYKKGWDQIASNTFRMQVPGGWLVKTQTISADGGVHQIFIKDENHNWKFLSE